MNALLILAVVVAGMVLVATAAGNPLRHSMRFRRRRLANWLPLGLTYAFLYMGRYNLTVSRSRRALGRWMSKRDFGLIFGAGSFTYAFSFLFNGPLTDRIGGKRAICIGTAGSAAMNGLLGVLTYRLVHDPSFARNIVPLFSLCYAVNMYFQSFGAVAIVKTNSAWFHLRERGSFGGLFGVLISLGIYFAFDWGKAIVEAVQPTISSELGAVQRLLHAAIQPGGHEPAPVWWLFWIPSLILIALGVTDLIVVRDRPGQAGLQDFATGDAAAADDEEEDGRFRLLPVLKLVLSNRVIWVIGSIEFCSGVLRQGIMHWYRQYVREVVPAASLGGLWFYQNWGLVLCIAGISGGLLAGFISDKLFGSRRGPVAALLYGVMLVMSLTMIFALDEQQLLGAVVSLMSAAVIGVHGMLSGTATMDFGGQRAAGTAVGVIDGIVYLGTGVQSVALGYLTTRDWSSWPLFLAPFALVGLLQAMRIWRALPEPR